MKFRWIPSALACIAVCPALADTIDDVRAGTDLDYDLKSMNYTYSGAASGSGTVADGDAPATCVPKTAGDLSFSFSARDLGFPFDATINMAGTKLSPTKAKWTTNTLVNQCVTIPINGVDTQVKIKRIVGQLTANGANFNPFFDSVCGRGYNVALDDTASDADSYFNVEAYALCIENAFTRINFQARSLDFVAYAGVPRGDVLATEFTVVHGTLFRGNLASLASSDNNRLDILSDDDGVGEVEIRTQSPQETLGSLTVTLEAYASRVGLTQSIQAYNYATSQYEEIASGEATLADSSASFVLSNSNIEAGTRNMKIDVNWQPFNDEVPAQDGWLQGLDVAKWSVAP